MRLRRRRLLEQGGGVAPPVPPPVPQWNTVDSFFDATAAVVLPFSGAAIPGTYIGFFVVTAPGSVTGNNGGLTVQSTTTLTPTSSGGRLTYLDGVVGSGNTPGTPITVTLDGASRWQAVVSTTNVPCALGSFTPNPINSNLTTVPTPSATGVAGQLATHWHGVLTNVAAVQVTWAPDPLTTQLVQGCSQSGSARNATSLLATELLVASGPTAVRTATVDGGNVVQRQSGLLLLTTL